MSRATHEPKVCAHMRPVEEWSDADIDSLVNFGRERAEIIDRLEEASRAGDDRQVLDLARALVGTADAAGSA